MVTELRVLPELRDFLDPGTAAENELLERDLLADGIRDNVIVWEGRDVIVDGHRRYEIARKHNLPFNVQEKPFADIEEVKDWMAHTQVQRRNVHGIKQDVLIARCYQKKLRDLKSEPQPNPEPGEQPKRGRRLGSGVSGKAKEAVAESLGVTTRTVDRANEVTQALEKIDPEIVKRIKAGEFDAKRADVIELASMPHEHQREVIAEVDRGEHRTLSKALHGSTPPKDDEALGEILQDTVSQKNETQEKPAKSLKKLLADCHKQLGLFSKAVDSLTADYPDAARESSIRSHVKNLDSILTHFQKARQKSAA